MSLLPGVPLSVLDLAPVGDGASASDAVQASLELARLADELGFIRFWLAEHYSMPGIASSAPAVLIGAVAAATREIRVGSGGVMLPNHAPLVVAEQFGTLAALHPGRIDLGLGRAPGTDPRTAAALRRSAEPLGPDDFPEQLGELACFLTGEFPDGHPYRQIRSVPQADAPPPIWLLGSSLYSAQLAAVLGLPFAFASHFAPDLLQQAASIYRARFQPSEARARPWVMLGLNVFAADTDAEARRLFTSVQQAFVTLRRGEPGPLPPPVDTMEGRWSPAERATAEHALRYAIVGSADTVRTGIVEFVEHERPDEIMATAMIFDHAARLRSFELLSEIAAGVLSR